MRTLSFAKDSIEYRLLHQASLQAELKPTPAEYRLIAAVQMRLEDAGVPMLEKKDPNDIVLFKCPKAATATFEEEEFRMLRKLFEATSYVPGVARQVAAVHDLLDSAKEEKPTTKREK